MTTDSMILGTPFGEHPTRILMLGSGELGAAITVKAAKFSASAKEAIEKAGGKAETL